MYYLFTRRHLVCGHNLVTWVWKEYKLAMKELWKGYKKLFMNKCMNSELTAYPCVDHFLIMHWRILHTCTMAMCVWDYAGLAGRIFVHDSTNVASEEMIGRHCFLVYGAFLYVVYNTFVKVRFAIESEAILKLCPWFRSRQPGN